MMVADANSSTAVLTAREVRPAGAIRRRAAMRIISQVSTTGQWTTGVRELPQWFLPTAQAMQDLFDLRPNWDTYGAVRIDPDILELAMSVLLAVQHRLQHSCQRRQHFQRSRHGLPAGHGQYSRDTVPRRIAEQWRDSAGPAGTSHGGVQLEWHTNKFELEVEFISPSRVRGFFEDILSGENWEKDLSFDFKPLSKWIVDLAKP